MRNLFVSYRDGSLVVEVFSILGAFLSAAFFLLVIFTLFSAVVEFVAGC